MARKHKTRDTKDRTRKAVFTQAPGNWTEVFAALDATGVKNGFTVERDMRPAEERPGLNAFFCC